ncbi:MAG: hypothetical protein ACREC3_13895 [Methyloceanibacter sp.]
MPSAISWRIQPVRIFLKPSFEMSISVTPGAGPALPPELLDMPPPLRPAAQKALEVRKLAA